MWQIKGKYEASWVHATELMKEREEKLDRAGRRGWGHQGTSLYSLGLIEGLKSDPDLVVGLLSPILPFSCFFSLVSAWLSFHHFSSVSRELCSVRLAAARMCLFRLMGRNSDDWHTEKKRLSFSSWSQLCKPPAPPILSDSPHLTFQIKMAF